MMTREIIVLKDEDQWFFNFFNTVLNSSCVERYFRVLGF